MKYQYHRCPYDVKEAICEMNHIDASGLDVSGFQVDPDLPLIQTFREAILSVRDRRFFIVGDYDCDGICATAIMKRLLEKLGISVNYYIPSRSKDGYGLNERIVQTAIDNHFDVLMCVDNGVKAVDALNKAREAGIMTVVIDHHEYQDPPEVDLFLHPDLFPHPYEDMCAAGLCALLANSIEEDDLFTVLGGLATLADMVSVFGYNRYLLKEMLKKLKHGHFPSISGLLGRNEPSFENLSFQVIPKINAVSRMESRLNVNHVVRYLLDPDEAMKYLPVIEEINRSRKQLTKEMASVAERLSCTDSDVILIHSETFFEGLCGLVANRLMYRFSKPVIVLSEGEGLLKGSGRSPKGSDLYTYLKETEGVFEAYGGHAQAIGVTLKQENLSQLAEYIKTHPFIYEEAVQNVLVLSQERIGQDLYDELEGLRPFGPGFEEPLIGIEDPQIKKRLLISGNYPKFILEEKLDAISFDPSMKESEFDLMVGRLKKDDYHKGSFSLIIEDLIQF